jgi:CHAT domain-containing protein
MDLTDVPNWIISPDGVLAQLPFELLSLQGQRILDHHQIHYTQSISAYALARVRQREYSGLRREQDLLALGNPEYQPTSSSTASRQARTAGLNLRLEMQLTDTRGLWEPLPGTDDEVKALRKIFPSGQTLTHAQASEARLLELNASGALKNYRFVHFATHGFFSSNNPALSSVVLSQVNLPPGTDGFITAAEWPGYDLRSDMVVLSACETGLGKNLSGEGVMGLPFALFVAGNVDAIASLWPVDDSATAIFMTSLYEKIKQGRSAAQALTETKREFAKHPKYSHPSYWAAFVLVGAG